MVQEWRTTGHELVGQRIKRVFGKKKRMVDATITKWLPEARGAGGEVEPALFRAVHDDGDEEDLEEDEAREAVRLYAEQPAAGRLQVTSYKLQVTAARLLVRAAAAGYKLQVRSYKLEVRS